MNGYLGKILRVDLDTKTTWDEPIGPSLAKGYIGGSGLAARYAISLIDRDTDPLGPDNPLIFMTGPMVGTCMPSAGRYSICARSPLTGLWGEANSGGFWGPELRFSGYDGIVITGRSPGPVWLSIVKGSVKLFDATELWGRDSYDTQQQIREKVRDPKVRVACIGPAGENRCVMAAVMNDHGRAAGRTGMGAVMGSKNLKAIAVRGKNPVPVADPEGLAGIVREINREMEDDLSVLSLRLAGTAGYVDMALMYGDAPIHYYQQGEWDEAGNLSGVLMTEEFLNRGVACYRCPIVCGRETRALAYGVEKVDGPEYETIISFGSLMMVDNLEAVIYAGHLCNEYGLDTISTGCTIALACELFERGVLSTEETGGLDIRYGDYEVAHRLIGLMAHREGFGDILAQGSRALAERYGVPDLAVTVNRLEVPMHDPRAFHGMAAIYALSPRGACHMEGDMYGVDTGQGPPVELGVLPGDRFDSSREKGRVSARQQAWRNLYNALTLCQFQNPGADLVCRSLNAITGWDLQLDDLMAAGKRITSLKRLLNLKLGLEQADERMPLLLTQPLEGGTEGHVPELDMLLDGAYQEYGWKIETGTLAPETMASLLLDLDQ